MKSKIKILFGVKNGWRIEMKGTKPRFALLFLCFLLLLPGLAFAQWSSDPLVNTPVVTAVNIQTSQKIIHDSNGGYFVVWQDYRVSPGEGDIYAQYFNAAGEPQWTENGVVVCDTSGNQWGPKVILDWAGGILVSWSDNTDGNIYVQRIDVDGNALWAAGGVGVIEDDECGWMASDGANGAIVMGYNGQVNRVAADGSLPWGDAENPVVYSVAGAEDEESWAPKIMSDGAGGAFLTWSENNDPLYKVGVQRVDRNGNLLWNNGDPVFLSDPEAVAGCPRIIPDGSGGAIITWVDWWSEGDPIYAQRVNGSGVPQWDTNGIMITANNNDYNGLASDGSGGAFVTWPDTDKLNLYAQRIGSDGNLLWADPVQITDTDDFYDTSDAPRKTVEDGSGGFITVWLNDDKEVMVQRVDGTGTPLWTANGVVLCNAAGSRGCPRIEKTGQGGAVAVWNDNRNSNQDIFIQGVDADGILGDPGFVPNATVTSTNATVSAVVAPDAPAGAPSGFSVVSVVSFTATGFPGTTADISLTYESLPANPLIYKVTNGVWKQIYPANQTTGITSVTLNGLTLSYSIEDGSDCDADGLVNGSIQDPVAAGGTATAPGTSSSGCFIDTIVIESPIQTHIKALIVLIGFGLAGLVGFMQKLRK